MKTKQTAEVIATRSEMFELERSFPNKSWDDWTESEKSDWHRWKDAQRRHHEAVRAARAA